MSYRRLFLAHYMRFRCWTNKQVKKIVVPILVTFVLGIICGQGHAGSHPSLITSCMTQGSAIQSFSVSTTQRLCHFPNIGTVHLAHNKPSKKSYYHHYRYHHYYPPPSPLLRPKGKREIYHKPRTLEVLCLECYFLWVFNSVTQILAPIWPTGVSSSAP